MSSKSTNIAILLVVLVGAFMVVDGVAALTGSTQGLGGFSHDVSRAFGGSGNTIQIIIAVAEIAAGALLVLSRFMSIGSLDGFLRIAVFLFWLAFMVFSLFLGGKIQAIDTLAWWKSFLNHGIILTVLWMIKDR